MRRCRTDATISPPPCPILNVVDDEQNMHTSSRMDDDAAIVTAREAAKDIAFGSFAGMISEVFEYPFDLAKVRLQAQMLSPASETQRRFSGPLDCLTSTWRDEGFRGLYRGLPAPLVGSMAETAALFFAYSSFQNLIRAYSFSRNSQDSSSLELSIPQLGLAAAGAGFATSFILTPIELVKCKMQVQMMNTHTSAHIPPIHATPKPIKQIVQAAASAANLSSTSARSQLSTFTIQADREALRKRLPGVSAIIRTTIRDHGVRGLWLGHTGTLLRETGGTASWFAMKELLASRLRERRLGEGIPGELLPWESALSGAISGGACVLALYPADTVKSAIQTEEELRPRLPRTQQVVRQTSSFWRTAVHLYKMHGIRGLYAGCGMTVARAVPSSGIVFVVYDGLNAWFG